MLRETSSIVVVLRVASVRHSLDRPSCAFAVHLSSLELAGLADGAAAAVAGGLGPSAVLYAACAAGG